MKKGKPAKCRFIKLLSSIDKEGEYKNMKKTLAWILAAVMVLSMLTACGGSAGDDQTPQGGDGEGNVTKIKVGIGTDAMPNCYLDKDGNLAGENYEVMSLVDELLPQYEFVYETGTQEAILIGLDTGTYQVGINNFFYNDDRATKYIFPEYPVAAGVRGLILRNEYKDKVTQGTTEEMLSQVAKLGLRNVPYSSDESGYTLYSNFNATHEEQLIFEVSEHAPIAVELQDVINGRYDMISDLRSSYTAVKDEIDVNDETFFIEFTDAGFGTWVLYGKDQQELVDAIDGAMAQLYEDGTMAAIAIKYYGENVFQYIDGFKYASVQPKADYQ